MLEGIVLAASVVAAPVRQAAQADPAQDFQASLAQVQELVQRGGFTRADQQLKALLAKHEDADYARRRQADLVDLAKRCAFRLAFAEPKPDALVSGDLVRWEPRTGDLEIRYGGSATLKDFAESPSAAGKVLVHPAVFVDTFAFEADLPANAYGGGKGPCVLVGVGTDESFMVCFGTYGEQGQTYTPPQILRMKGGDREVVDRQDKPAAPYDKRLTLKVSVGEGAVTAYRDGKRLLQAKRSTRESGQIALVTFATFNKMTLRGKVQGSWLQGLLDGATQTALADFEKKWKPEQSLPAWLFEPIAAPAATGAGGGAGSRAAPPSGALEPFAKRCAALELATKQRTLAEREATWKELVAAYPGESAAWIGLAFLQLRLGRSDAASATVDAALAAGIASAKLDPLPRMIVHSRNGPEWTRVFTQESAHYVVKSDIDQAVCLEASKALEESYRSYGFRLAQVPGLEKKKFSVFLFAGKSGYLDYAKDTLDAAPASSAGLYSPALKQLLIWNLPDRAAMYRTVRHEGFHQYFDRLADDPPIWFNEGMAEYYELADVYGGEWKEGQVHDEHVDALLGASWVPLRTLLDMEPRVFQGKNIGLHYAESWAIVHYLRRGPKEAQAAFQKFWSALCAGKSSDVATKEAFGEGDVSALENAVKDWVRKLD